MNFFGGDVARVRPDFLPSKEVIRFKDITAMIHRIVEHVNWQLEVLLSI